MKFDELTLYEAAMKCNVCDGAGYQAPPALFVGLATSPILIVGQNPGEMRSHEALDAAEIAAGVGAREFNAWYEADFLDSLCYKKIARLTSNPSWHIEYLLTNAVLCRTKENAHPSSQMKTACSVWTAQLAFQRKGIVLMGAVAQEQFLGAAADHTRDGELSKFRGKYVLPIFHYASSLWNAEKYKKGFERLVSKVDDKA